MDYRDSCDSGSLSCISFLIRTPMFKQRLTISSLDDTRTCLDSFTNQLSRASLAPEINNFLEEQVATTLLEFAQQLSAHNIRQINAERVLEGDGYKITLKLSYPKKFGISQILKNIFNF